MYGLTSFSSWFCFSPEEFLKFVAPKQQFGECFTGNIE